MTYMPVLRAFNLPALPSRARRGIDRRVRHVRGFAGRAQRQFNRFLDAYIDYRALGGIDGRYPEVKKWLSEVLPNFPVYAHMLGNFSVRIDGDTASSRVMCFNPMVLAGDSGQVLFCGLWYDDEFVRTPAGWRMTRRVETKTFQKVM